MTAMGLFATRLMVDGTVYIVDRYTGDMAAMTMTEYVALPEERYAAVCVYADLDKALEARRVVLAQRKHP